VAFLKQAIGLGVALRSAVLDRFSGLFILMLAIVITLPLYSKIIPSEQEHYFLVEALSITFGYGDPVSCMGCLKVMRYLNPTPLLSKLVSLVSDIWLFRKGKSLWRQLWTSAIVHLNGIAAYGLLGIALGLRLIH